MQYKINSGEITLKVYQSGSVGRGAGQRVYWHGGFDLRGVIKGLREENKNPTTEEWLEVKKKFYETFFKELPIKLEDLIETSFGEGIITEIATTPLYGSPEYCFGQGNINLVVIGDNQLSKEDVEHIFTSAISSVAKKKIKELEKSYKIKCSFSPNLTLL